MCELKTRTEEFLKEIEAVEAKHMLTLNEPFVLDSYKQGEYFVKGVEGSVAHYGWRPK